MASPVVAPPTTDPTAVTGRRTVAAIIDGAVVLVPTIAIATSEMEYITRERVGRRFDDFCDDYLDQISGVCVQVGDRAYFSDGTADNPAGLAFPVLSLLLLVVLQGLTGWTIGKLLMGLRTVREDGSRLGIGKAFVRWLLLLIDALPCIPLVGFILVLTTQGHRRVGDMAAKTFVVRSSAAGGPLAVPGVTAPMGASAPPPPSPATPIGAASWLPEPRSGDPSSPPPPPTGPAPQWDAARGTYIQWDPALSQWMQWDDARRTWSPIPGQ